MGLVENIAIQKQKGIPDSVIDKFMHNKLEDVLKTIQDVQILLLWGWEFGVEYKGYTGFITISGSSNFTVGTDDPNCEKGSYYDTDDIDDFAENAKLGPFYIKDIVGKWTITWRS